MYGPAWLVTRTTTRPVTLDGHPIPKGADVVYSPYIHQHDPEVYNDPSAFDPDRWEPERAKASTGPRSWPSAMAAASASAKSSPGRNSSSSSPRCSNAGG